jgi:predicted HD superfamily hydrolase involved in NAD metabolism
MSNYEYIKSRICLMIGEKRFKHCTKVEIEAVKLGSMMGIDIDKCRIAAITHDCAKDFSSEQLMTKAKEYGIEVDYIQRSFPQLLHGPVGAMFCKHELNINDEDIINAVWYHTTGRENMTVLEKIIYLADVIEEGRNFPGVEKIRELAVKDIDKALVLSCNCTLVHVIEKNFLVHPLTIEFRNSLLLKGGK